MAILKQVTHEGDKYNLGTIERVAAEAAHQSIDPKPNQNGVQRVTTDAATTITATDTLIDFAVDAGGSRIVTMPAAIAGRKIRCQKKKKRISRIGKFTSRWRNFWISKNYKKD